ncbi:cell division protein FtsL [Marinicella litoralis]|uniref:Cell division protein FtsL n=1 Tax=Marinicella litoralis TaxID=644220 RepID=A0A4R6XS32_9GAMM|nr:cell division protein FtsL [Marinicella litoralis]TDR22732.1 cell division protein FtsL [Marinicella litoralis]
MNIQSGMTAVLILVLIWLLVGYVYYQNETRKLFAATQKIEKQKLDINAEWARLQIEKSTLVANNRIEKVAREQLSMKMPDEEQILVITR